MHPRFDRDPMAKAECARQLRLTVAGRAAREAVRGKRGGSTFFATVPDGVLPPRRCPLQDGLRQQSLGNAGPGRAHQTLQRPAPRVRQARVHDREHVLPGRVGTQPAHVRHPIACAAVQVLQERIPARKAKARQHRPVARHQPPIAASTAFGTRRGEARHGALADQRPFELGHRAQDGEHRLSRARDRRCSPFARKPVRHPMRVHGILLDGVAQPAAGTRKPC